MAGPQGAEEVDVEAFGYNTNGAVVFDGGSYTAGPEYLGTLLLTVFNDLSMSQQEFESDSGTWRKLMHSGITLAAMRL